MELFAEIVISALLVIAGIFILYADFFICIDICYIFFRIR